MSYLQDQPFQFKWILNELNYGALEKDTRLKYIGSVLKKDIEYNVVSKNENIYRGDVDVTISNKNFTIYWNIKIVETLAPRYFMEGLGKTKIDDSTFLVSIFIHRHISLSKSEFYKRLVSFVQSPNLYKGLLHEIKHILDDIDGLFTTNKYILPLKDEDYFERKRNFSKYMSQNREIDAFLISVLADIKMIHDQQPHLSFETVTQNSHYYNQFIENLSKKHINKYKNKIIYFWDELQRKVDT